MNELYSKCRFSKNAGSCKRVQRRAQDILYVYCFMHTISATDLPISEHQGLCPLKNNRAFGRPAKETVFGTTERKSCWTTSSNWSYGPYEWKVGKAEFAEIWWVQCANSGQHCSLSAVQRKKSHAGLNLICLDQSHGVGSHDTSSCQGWRKIIVVQSTDLQSKFDPRVYIRVFNQPALCRFLPAGKPSRVRGWH